MSNKVTLKGVLNYPHLNSLDTKFNDEGEFKTGVVVQQSTHQAIADQLEKILEDYRNGEGKRRNNGKVPKASPDGLPFDIDEDEGTITFRTKSKTYKNKETGKRFAASMAFFMNGESLGFVKVDEDELVASDTVPNIGGGTKAMVSCEVRPWVASGKAGVSLRPRAFKIVELIERVEGGSEDAFFGDDEDDFDAPTVNTSNEAPEDFGDDDF